MIDKYDVTNPELFCERHDLGDGQHRVRVSARPVWYVKGDGKLDRIDHTFGVESTRHAVRRNTFEFEADDGGATRIVFGDHHLAYVPLARGADLAKRPTSTLDRADRLRHGTLWPGVDVQYDSEPGRLKETLVLSAPADAARDAKQATCNRFAYRYNSDLDPVVVDGGGVEWRDGDRTMLRTQALEVWDADDNPGVAHYEIDATAHTLTIVVDPDWLAGAVYPVYIDPTSTTSQSDCSANRYGTYQYDDKDAFGPAYIRFTLPDLTGFASISAAELKITQAYSNKTSSLSISVYCDAVGSWTESSAASVLNALSFNAYTDTVNMSYSLDNLETLDVLGVSTTNGIAKIYADDASPDPCTVRLESGSRSSFSTGCYVGKEADSAVRKFYARTVTDYPYLEITYSTGSSGSPSTTPGVAVGVMMF